MAPPHGFEAPSDSLSTARAERKGVDFQVMGRGGLSFKSLECHWSWIQGRQDSAPLDGEFT